MSHNPDNPRRSNRIAGIAPSSIMNYSNQNNVSSNDDFVPSPLFSANAEQPTSNDIPPPTFATMPAFSTSTYTSNSSDLLSYDEFTTNHHANAFIPIANNGSAAIPPPPSNPPPLPPGTAKSGNSSEPPDPPPTDSDASTAAYLKSIHLFMQQQKQQIQELQAHNHLLHGVDISPNCLFLHRHQHPKSRKTPTPTSTINSKCQ